MANKITNTENYTNIANAIRQKNGSSNTYTPAQMGPAILAIPTGGGADILPFVSGYKIKEEQGVKSYIPLDLDISDEEIYLVHQSFARRENNLAPSAYNQSLSEAQNAKANINVFPWLGTVKLPETLIAIGTYAFYNQNMMTLPEGLPVGLEKIASQAFYGCTALDIEELSASITSIASGAFSKCGIVNLDIKCDLNTYDVFSYSTKLETVKIRSVHLGTASNNRMFQGCTKLENVWISEDCIQNAASSETSSPFFGCSSLTDIYCEAASKPADWGDYWNYKAANVAAAVHWGTSESDFDNIINI